jgi:hypothetical protein
MIRISVAQLNMEPLSYLVLLKHTNALLVVYFEYFLVRKSTVRLIEYCIEATKYGLSENASHLSFIVHYTPPPYQ